MYRLFQLLNKVPRGIRLLVSLVIGIAIFLIFRSTETPAASFMYGWIGFTFCVLFFSWLTIMINDPKHVAEVASEQDGSRLFVFLFAIAAAVFSLFAIIFLLRDLPKYSRVGLNYHIFLSIVAVTCSWLLIHTLFTLRYAHLYYSWEDHAAKQQAKHYGGLQFPGHELPDLVDFAYFSFVLGMTFQVSDVVITAKRFRRLALLHGILSFVYNTAIVALTINILSGIVGR